MDETNVQLMEDPQNPANIRPIPLTSCIGKLFTSPQEPVAQESRGECPEDLMAATPACTEHQGLKFATRL